MVVIKGIIYSLVNGGYVVGTNTDNLLNNRNAVSDSDLKNVYIPEKIEGKKVFKVGTAAFRYSNIVTAFVPATVTSIGIDGFGYCHCLEEITFAEGSALKSIDQGGFYDCPLLRTIRIPQRVNTIVKWAFGKSNLTSFYYCGRTDFSKTAYIFALADTNARQYFPRYLFVSESYKGTSFSDFTELTRFNGCKPQSLNQITACYRYTSLSFLGQALIIMMN